MQELEERIKELNKIIGENKYVFNNKTNWIYRFDKKTNSYIPHTPVSKMECEEE